MQVKSAGHPGNVSNLAGLLLLLLVFLGSWGWSSEAPQWPVLWQGLQGIPLNETDTFILLHLRLPRLLLGMLSGMALSVSGLMLQGLFRNPLMDPFILGISGGGALGAGVAILFGLQWSLWGLSSVTLAAFVGASAMLLWVYRLGHYRGMLVMDRLLLAGVALSAMASALLSLILVIRGEGMEKVVYWIMGSLNGKGWSAFQVLILPLVIALPLMYQRLHALNILQTGEEVAHSLGLNTRRLKIEVLVLSSLLAAAVVSVCGVIGFVGLMVPHMVRLVYRTSDFRQIFWPCLWMGGALLIFADAFARNALPQQEIPVGIFTALLGVPFFLSQLRKTP